MITIRNWDDLQKEGVNILTGEACAYGYRLLCDVNSRGMELLAKVFDLEGGPIDRGKLRVKEALNKLTATTNGAVVDPNTGTLDSVTPENERRYAMITSFLDRIQPMQLRDSWNGSDNADFSIMLPRCMFEPLAIMACFRANCSKVYVMHSGEVHGVEGTDKQEDLEQFVRWNQGTLCEECNRYGKGGGIMYQYSNPGYDRNRHQMSGRTR